MIDYELIYQQAEENHSFKTLIPYKRLLTRWQIRHRDDLLRIAAIGSHRLDKHLFCTEDGKLGSKFSQEKCNTIDQFIKENS